MEFRENVPLAPYTTFHIGGPARWFADATSEADVVQAARFACEHSLPLFPLGGGSNLLVSDAGYRGLVLRIALDGIDREQQGSRAIFHVAAGVCWDDLVSRTVAEDCAGIECLAGIPGTTGGTPVQNVGAYGQEVSQTIACVRGYDPVIQQFHEWGPEECDFSYRRSRFNAQDRGRFIVTRIDFALTPGGAPNLQYPDLKRHFTESHVNATLESTSSAVRLIRKNKGMVLSPDDPNSRSAGSFFKNPIVPLPIYARIAESFAPAPVPHYPAPSGPSGEPRVKLPAAWLLEKAGFHRGFARGEAGISSCHTLALINRGSARAADVLALRDEIIAGVLDQFGVPLEPEPVWLG